MDAILFFIVHLYNGPLRHVVWHVATKRSLMLITLLILTLKKVRDCQIKASLK